MPIIHHIYELGRHYRLTHRYLFSGAHMLVQTFFYLIFESLDTQILFTIIGTSHFFIHKIREKILEYSSSSSEPHTRLLSSTSISTPNSRFYFPGHLHIACSVRSCNVARVIGLRRSERKQDPVCCLREAPVNETRLTTFAFAPETRCCVLFFFSAVQHVWIIVNKPAHDHELRE
jgi:hypothetical protein